MLKDLERTRTCNGGDAREVSKGRRALKTIRRLEDACRIHVRDRPASLRTRR